MTRFFLTTAIDYVNSRPHLGTAYEKVCADVIARYKRLARLRHALPDGQRRALAERLQEGARGGARSARVLRPDGAGVPPDLAAARRVVRRLHPDDGAAPQGGRHRSRPADSTRRATSTKASTKAGTASAARSSRQDKDLVDGKCPLHPTLTPEWIREKNYFFRLSKYQQPLARSFRGPSRISPAGDPPERDSAPDRRRPRQTSRSAAPGSRGAFRCRSTRTASSTSGSTR